MAASKNRGIRDWQTEAAFGSLLLLTVAPVISRGVLSVSLIVFVAITLLHRNFWDQVKAFARTPFLLSLSLLFFIPFVSGLWSHDLERWSDVVRVKLPLLFLPLAAAGNWQLSRKQWRWLTLLFLLLVFGGCCRSLADYAQNVSQIHESYLRAKTLRTPFENDHVRFSWLVSVAAGLCFLLMRGAQQKAQRFLLTLLCAFFIVYLHVLSVRTGLLALYLFITVHALHFFLTTKNRREALLLLCLPVALPLIAYLLLPTFKARLQYNLYDLSFVKKAAYLPGSSDGARAMSLKAGWQVLTKNPFGAGAGDVLHEAEEWYAVHVPQVLPSDKFYPCSEWLVYGGFAGWGGVALFTVVMAVPFFARRIRHRVFWTGFHATAAFSFVFDTGLETQYGIFLYAVLACLLWKGLADVNHEPFLQRRK